MEVRIGIFPEGYGLQQFAQVGAAPLPEPPPGVQRIRVGGAVQASKLTNQVRPFYPPEAKEIRLSGMVRMNILVAREGNILNITVISGHPLLVPAAMEAVKQWRYSPTLLNGVPVEVVTEADVNFTLSQ